jgi:putative component of membrane protein insertase Oxa1/YidC/SpoIIIJ protein YidD
MTQAGWRLAIATFSALALVAGSSAIACRPVPRVGASCPVARPFKPFDERLPAPRHAIAPAALLDALLVWYQDRGRARTLPGTGCPFAPTCSVYARTALRRYGPLGVILIVDRLIVREHPAAAAYYPTICVDHTTRLVDGVP